MSKLKEHSSPPTYTETGLSPTNCFRNSIEARVSLSKRNYSPFNSNSAFNSVILSPLSSNIHAASSFSCANLCRSISLSKFSYYIASIYFSTSIWLSLFYLIYFSFSKLSFSIASKSPYSSFCKAKYLPTYLSNTLISSSYTATLFLQSVSFRTLSCLIYPIEFA